MTRTVIERGTLYRGSGFAYRRTEARQISYEIAPQAQFAQAIKLTFTENRHRKRIEHIFTGGQIVILTGWNHPIAPGEWSKGTPMSPISTDSGEVRATVHHTRFPLGDERWITEFNEFLKSYLKQSGSQLLLDFRNHDFRDKYGPQIKWTDLTPEMPVHVTGVVAGQIVPVNKWPQGEIPSQEFPNMAEAQRVFPNLSLNRSSKRIVDKIGGSVCTRFDSFDVYERLSR